MLNLIYNEYLKIKKSKVIGIFLLSQIALIWINASAYNPKDSSWELASILTFPSDMLDIYTQLLIFFVPIIMSQIVTEDLLGGTLKLSIMNEPVRYKHLLSKLLSFLLVILFSTFFFLLICYLIGVIYLKNTWQIDFYNRGSSSLDDFLYTLVNYSKLLMPIFAYGSVTMLLGLFIKSSIAVNITMIFLCVFFFNTQIGQKLTSLQVIGYRDILPIIVLSLLIGVFFFLFGTVLFKNTDILY